MSIAHIGYCHRDGKRQYRSHHEAKLAAREHGGHVSEYKCPHCRKYHVTHYTKRVSKAIGMLLGRAG